MYMVSVGRTKSTLRVKKTTTKYYNKLYKNDRFKHPTT